MKNKILFEIDLTYQEFLLMASKATEIVKSIISKNKNYYEGLVCPLRGGFYLTDFISRRVNLVVNYLYISSYNDKKEQKEFIIHFLPELKKHKRYLICDDILATGNTIRKIVEMYPNSKFEVITLYKHKNRTYPVTHYAIREVESYVWVNFFWEKIN